MGRLNVALLGLAEVGGDYLAVLRADEQFHLAAIADTNPELLRHYAETFDGRLYEDYRSLIVETDRVPLDMLLFALEPFQSLEFVEMAAQRGIAVFCKAPFARTVREAEGVIQRFAKGDVLPPKSTRFMPKVISGLVWSAH